MTRAYRPKTATAIIIALSLVLAAVVGCADSDSGPGPSDGHGKGLSNKPPATSPDIRGSITTLTKGDGSFGRVSILVEGVVEEDTGYDKASVTIPADVPVFASDSSLAVIDDLAEGQRVEVWFTGPVAESYPVQATAGAVRILDALER